MRRDLSKISFIFYAVLAFPLSFAGLPIYVHSPDFYATDLGLSLSALGVILLLLRSIDALQDPFLGFLSDRYQHSRVVALYVGVVMLGIGFVMTFNPLIPSLWWFCISIFICTTGFSLVTINFHTLGGLWDVKEHTRTKVTALREGFSLLGLLTASVLPAILMLSFEKKDAFALLSFGYIPILIIGFFIFLRWHKHAHITQAPQQDEATLPFKTLIKDKWTQIFFLIYGVSNFASAIPAILVIFFIRDKLDAENLTGLFLFLYFLSGAAFMPVWQKVSAKFGKINAWGYSIIAAVITFIWAFFIGSGDIVSYGFICVLSGAALGADLALPPSILADKIDRDQHQKSASKYFAILTFLTKSSFALATGLTLPALALSGYIPGTDLTSHASLALSVSYALIPCLLKIVCFWVLKYLSKISDTHLYPHISIK